MGDNVRGTITIEVETSEEWGVPVADALKTIGEMIEDGTYAGCDVPPGYSWEFHVED